MIATSLNAPSADDIACVDVPITWFTYATTLRCSSDSNRVIFLSSATVFEFSTFAATFATDQRPFSHVSSKSNSVSRCPHFSGSDNTTSLPVALFFTRYSGISVCACPTRIASIPGTCSATSAAAFSMYGNWSPYEDVPLEPECADTITTSAPIDRSFGTYFAACSSSPGNVIFPCTFALSQIAIPGFVSPSTATFTSRPHGVRSLCMLYGANAGRNDFASSAFAPSSGKSHCSSNFRSTGMP